MSQTLDGMWELNRLKKKWIKMTNGKNINIYNGELNSIYKPLVIK